MLFKPVTVMARLGLLTKVAVDCGSTWRVRQVLAIGYQHRGACPTRWSTPTAIRSWTHQIPRAL